jgi:Flp pilus assembly protein TadG
MRLHMTIAQPVSRLKNAAVHYARRLKSRSQKGVSAVEFALIAPLMVLMLFGAAEASLAVTLDRKTTLAASTLGDLAAQTDLVSCAELAQISAVTRQVFEPYSGENATMVVAGLLLVGGVPKVEWSRFLRTDSSNGTILCDTVPNTHSLFVGNSVTVDTALFAAGGGLVIGDVEMVHTSIGTSFIANNLKLHERFYLRPRKSLKLKMCTQTGGGVTAATCTSTT